MSKFRQLLGGVALTCSLSAGTALAQEGGAGRAISAAQGSTREAVRSQDRVDQLDDQTRKMLEEYRSASWEAQQLSVYADQLESLVEAQSVEKASLERQTQALDRTEQELLPLMLRTVDYLEKFISLDLPFLMDERTERIASLRKLMNDPAATHADRFRRILEALQIELNYGRSLGAERRDVEGRSVDVLRLGRIEMYSLSADGSEVARWDKQSNQWVPMSHRHAGRVRQGLRMAREIVAPDLIALPLQPEERVR